MSRKEGVDAGTRWHGYLITPATNKDRTTITKKRYEQEKKINEGKNRIFTELNVKMRFCYDVDIFFSTFAYARQFLIHFQFVCSTIT